MAVLDNLGKLGVMAGVVGGDGETNVKELETGERKETFFLGGKSGPWWKIEEDEVSRIRFLLVVCSAARAP